MKNSFILYTDYMTHLEFLNMEQRGVLLTALMMYQQEESMPEMDAITNMAFSFIRQDIDANNEKWEETRKKRSEAGKKGGRPAKTNESNEKQTKAKKANALLEKQTKAKKAVNVNVNDNVNVNVNDNNNITPITPLKKRKPTVAESRVGKIMYADEVYMKEEEYQNLVNQYGKDGAQWMIDKLNAYKKSSSKTYVDDRAAIRSWVEKEYLKGHPKGNNPWNNNSVDQEALYKQMLGIT